VPKTIVIAAALIALGALVAGTPAPAAAQSGTPTVVTARVDPVVATVGERLTLTIVVAHERGVTLTGPDEDGDYGQAVFIETAPLRTEASGDGERTTLTSTLASFSVGQHDIPPLAISWRSETDSGEVTTPAAPFTIDSVLQPGDTTLRPLKPQLSIPEPAPPPYVPATFVALMAGLTVAGYWLVRRSLLVQPARGAEAVPAVPPRDPEEQARAELSATAASGLTERDVPEYYARIAATLRRYLSARFGVPAYAMTRSEIERGMEQGGMDRWPARLASNLLEQCEAAEFAKFVPARERREQDLAAAFEIVRLAEAPEADDDDAT
jgi:hypothetical protein